MNLKGFLKFIFVILIASIIFRSVIIGIAVLMLYLGLGAIVNKSDNKN